MSRLYEGEPPGHTSTLSPRRFSLEMWEGSLSSSGKSTRSGREVDYPAVLFKNLLGYRGLSHDFFRFTWWPFSKFAVRWGGVWK